MLVARVGCTVPSFKCCMFLISLSDISCDDHKYGMHLPCDVPNCGVYLCVIVGECLCTYLTHSVLNRYCTLIFTHHVHVYVRTYMRMYVLLLLALCSSD